MRYTSSFFLKGTFLASGSFASDFRPHSLAFFCHTCGDIWGRISMHCPNDPGFHEHWAIEHSPCKQHTRTGVQDWSALPGSFLPESSRLSLANLSAMSWARAIEHLPQEVLKREFELTTEWYDKLKGQEDANQ